MPGLPHAALLAARQAAAPAPSSSFSHPSPAVVLPATLPSAAARAQVRLTAVLRLAPH
jgi:hypothetical protein